MRDTLRLNRLLKTAVPQAGVSVCLNRVGAGGAGELARADFEKGAEISIDVSIPEDVKAFAASAAAGKPILKVASRSKAATGLRNLAGRLGGARVKNAPFPMLRRLLAGGR
jgi:Flp pilus assembly CpaE family ATPase